MSDEEDIEEIYEDEEEGPPSGFLGGLREIIEAWTPAILAILAIRTFLFEPFRIPSGSMVPTLLIGDHVLVSKYSYGIWVPYTGIEIPFLDYLWVVPRFELLDLGDPEKGDIIVFRYPKDERLTYIKRVVGTPGDKIRVQNNQIFINGEAMEREYVGRYEYVDERCNERQTKHFVEDLDGHEHDLLTNLLPGPRANKAEIVVPEGHIFAMGDNRDNSEDSRGWGFVRYDQVKGKAHFVWLSWNSCAESIRTDRFIHWLR